MQLLVHISTLLVALTQSVRADTVRESCLNVTQLTVDFDKYTQAINNYNGSLSTVGPLSDAQAQVEVDWKNINSCRQSYVPSTAEYQAWVQYCNSTLLPTVRNFVSAYKRKESSFKSSGFGGSMQGELKNYRNATLTYRDKVVPPITDSQTKSKAITVLNTTASTFYNPPPCCVIGPPTHS